MPDLSSIASTLRSDGHFAELYISTPSEPVIFRALVNQTTFSYPLLTLTFDTVTVGAFGDIQEDMEVLVYNQSTSTIKGRLRVAPGAASATVLQVNEFSEGRLSVANNDKIEVLRSWRLRDRMPAANTSFNKDGRIAYSDQGSNPPPVVCSGGHWIGFVDDGQTYATVPFPGVSINIDPDSSASQTHLWDAVDGTYSVGSNTSANPTIRFPVGERWVKHTVTDSGNGKSEVQWIWVRVFDQTGTRPTNVIVEDRGYNHSGGWYVRVTVPAGWTTSQAPDGALIAIWAREYYGASVGSYGAAMSGRSHIKFIGHLVADSVQIDPETGSVSFDAISPLALLGRLPGFSQVIRNRTAPGNWKQIKTLTTNRAFWYLLRWGSTYGRLYDLVMTANNYIYPDFYLQEMTTDAQMRELSDGIGALLTCDRTGRLLLLNDPDLMTTAQRNALTTTYTITDADWVELELDRDHRYEYNTVEGRGFVGGATQAATKPILSLAPGRAPSEGPSKTAVERQIVEPSTGQATLNERTGRLYAKKNNLYFGLPIMRGRVKLRSGYDVFDPAYGEWLKMTLDASRNKRGIGFTDLRLVVDSESITYDPETLTNEVWLDVHQEVDGVAGVTKKAATKEKNNLPSITPPSIEVPYYAPPAPVALSGGTMFLVHQVSTGGFVTSDFNIYAVAGGPVWSSKAFGITLSGTVCDFVVDPFSPKYLTGTGAVNGWIVTTTSIYKINDIFGTISATLQHTFASSSGIGANNRKIHTGRMVQNHVAVSSYHGSSGGTKVAYTTNGSTWTEVTITSFYNTVTSGVVFNGATMTPTIWVSEHLAGHVYAGAFTATGASQAATAELFRSIDYGATWSQISGMSTQQLTGLHLHIPFQDNPLDALFYWSNIDTLTSALLQRTNKNGSVDTIDPTPGVSKSGGFVASCGLDRRRLVVSSRSQAGATTGIGIYISFNAGDDWINVVPESNVIGNRYLYPQFNDATFDQYYVAGEDGKIGYGNMSTLEFENRQGNILTSNNILAIAGN